MCGTDHEQFSGNFTSTGMTHYPLIPGHEMIGRVQNIGPRAEARWGITTGDRVAVESIVPCAVCRECTEGDVRFCRNRFLYGFTETTVAPGLWGGYAEYMVLRPNTVLHKLPDHISVQDAVLFNPLGGGLDWAYRSVGTEVGDTVLILGPGQRGLACVIAAVEAGADKIIVSGLSRDERKLELARVFGATHTIDVETDDLLDVVQAVTGGELADRVIDVTPYATRPIVDAIDAVRPGGTIALAGVKGMREVPGFISDKLFLKGITIRGVYAVSSWAYSRAIRIISSGRYPLELMHTHTIGIDDLEFGIRLLAGEIDGEEAIHITVVPS